MPACEFGERQFEFCTNYQLQSALGAYLVGGMPSIPSQVDEALRGYDAAYAFSGGSAMYLQYKIAYLSETRSGLGAPIFDLWGGPYLRAQLHRDRFGGYSQHNTLVALASGAAEAFYVAPCFASSDELRDRFATGSGSDVVTGSLFGSLDGVPTIADTGPHSISYPTGGLAFRLHSDASEPFEAPVFTREALMRSRSTWDEGFFQALLDQLVDALSFQGLETYVEPPPSKEGPLARIASLLDQRLGAVLALFPFD